MKWETVKISSNSRGRGTPYASIGFGRVSLSAAACELIDGHQEIKYVEFLKATINNKLCIGLRLHKEYVENSVAVSRKKDSNGKYVTGMDITNKPIVGELFGLTGLANKVTRFKVRKDDDESNVLIIYTE